MTYTEFKQLNRISVAGSWYSISSHTNYNILVGTKGNGRMFDTLEIDKEEFCLKILGYCNPGDFPPCTTMFDLYRLCMALISYNPFYLTCKIIEIEI